MAGVMRWQVVRTILPAISVLVTAVALAQPPADAPAGDTPAAAEERPRRSRSRDRARSSRRTRSSRAAAPRDRTSVSVGHHNRGRLLNGTELVATEHLRLKHPDGDQHHGTDELVALLNSASDTVWTALPGNPLTLGDLSRHSGGRFRPHRSHQNGRDADVGFFIHDLEGSPVASNRFVDFGPMGTTRHDPSWRFDDARNWILVEYLLTQTEAPVQYLFISRELRRRLLVEGSHRGADPEILARAARVLYQPPVGGRHRDHLHVRVFCDPSDQPRCHNDGPLHPWLRGISALEDAASRSRTGLEDVVSALAFFSPSPDTEAEAEIDEEPAPRSRARSRRRRSSRSRSRSRR